jgi:hypothetical protein
MAHRLPTKDIEFIRDFAAFCRTKGERSYPYLNIKRCAAAQFLKETGRARFPHVGGDEWSSARYLWLLDRPFPEGVGRAVCMMPRTFSALATRLEALLIETSIRKLSPYEAELAEMREVGL